MVIAVVGAGGKTTRIHKLAEKYRAEGKKVLVTTTTHMFVEEGTDLSCNVEEICKKLESCGYCMAGALAESTGTEKMKALPLKVYEAVCQKADVVLVEADGSKHFPVKFPAAHEPVIPENAEEIHVVIGLSGLGKPLKNVCHRKELVAGCLGVSEETILTEEHFVRILEEGYLKPLRGKYPEKKIMAVPGQRDLAEQLRNEKLISIFGKNL